MLVTVLHPMLHYELHQAFIHLVDGPIEVVTFQSFESSQKLIQSSKLIKDNEHNLFLP